MHEELSTRIQLKRDLAANWNAVSSSFTLLSGELGFETDTGLVKIGIGKTWGETPYILLDSLSSVKGLEGYLTALKDELVADISTAKDEAILSANAYTDEKFDEVSSAISGLSGEWKAGEQQIVDTVSQDKGQVSVTYKTLTIDGVSGLADELDAKATKEEVAAVSATLSTDYTKKIEDAIDGLDVAEVTNDASKTIKSYKEENGIVTIETQDISITESQVNGLEGDLDVLSDAIDTINDETIPGIVSDLESSLSIALSSEEGTGDILKTYTITQGDRTVGTIDIPKDLVIERAGVIDYNGTDTKITIGGKEYDVQGTHQAGKYIVMITAVSENQLWILAKDLVDVYTGGETATVTVDVDSTTNVITASVKAGSLTRSYLSSDLTDELDGLRDDIDQVSSDVAAEEARAKAAEEVLSGLVEAEEARAKAAEEVLSGLVDAEAARATEAEADLQAAINAEAARAAATESELDAKIDAETARAEAAEEALKDLVDAEEARATAAETALQTAIGDEEARATAAESTLSGLIDTERTERTNADSTLQTNINNLSIELTTAINNEASTRETNDNALDAKIDANTALIEAETTRAEAKESALSTKIDAEISRAKAAEEANATAIATEKSRAEGAEAALQTAIDNEVTRATEAEADLQAAIDALSTYADETYETKVDATAKYNELTGKIADEATARSEADDAIEAAAALSVFNLSSEIYGDVMGGKAALIGDNKIATLADIAGLSGVIHFRGVDDSFLSGDGTTIPDTEWYAAGNKPAEGDIIINTSTSKEFLFTGTYSATDPTSGKWRELGDEGLYATKQELQVEIERATAAEQTLSDMVAAEEAARIADDEVLSGAIDDEVSRATAAESTLSTKIDNEITRAEGIEDELSTAIKQKVWIKDAASAGYEAGKYSDLSVIKISEDEYMTKVADGTLLADGVLYVISADHINAYGLKIVNVAAPTDLSDATNKEYVDTEIKKVADSALSAIELNGLSFDIADNKATLVISSINCGTAAAVA